MKNYIFLFLFGFLYLSACAQVKPNEFAEETNPTDANFEVYSQKNGVNRRAKLSNIAKTVGPIINAVPIGFTPPSTGNTLYLRNFVIDPLGNYYFIDQVGKSILVRRGDAVGGDLAGNLPTPTVDGLQGYPVANDAPSSGHVLKWNGVAWAPAAESGGVLNGDATGASTANTVVAIQSIPVSDTAPDSGQVLKYNGTEWTPGTDETGTGGDDWGSQVVVPDGVSIGGTGVDGDSLKWLGAYVSLPLIGTGEPGLPLDLATGDYSDIDVTNEGITWTIDTGVVNTVKLADAAVTGAKMAQAGATAGQVLKWDGATWSPDDDIDTNDDWGTQVVETTARISGDGTTGQELDIAQQGASSGQVLKWNGSTWSPDDDEDTTYSPGTGIDITATTITNTGDTDPNDDITGTIALSQVAVGSGADQVGGSNALTFANNKLRLVTSTPDTAFIISQNYTNQFAIQQFTDPYNGSTIAYRMGGLNGRRVFLSGYGFYPEAPFYQQESTGIGFSGTTGTFRLHTNGDYYQSTLTGDNETDNRNVTWLFTSGGGSTGKGNPVVFQHHYGANDTLCNSFEFLARNTASGGITHPDSTLFRVGNWDRGAALNILQSRKIGIKTKTPLFSLDVNDTDGIRLPRGTTAQRPSSTPAGVLRFNTDSTALEVGTGAGWTKLGAGGGGGDDWGAQVAQIDATLTGDGTGGDPLGIAAGGVGTAHLAANAVTTTEINNSAVTYAKMQNISTTDRLLGRDASGAGLVEELTVSGGVEFNGLGGIQTSAFTGDVTKSAGGTATTIATNAVTTGKINDAAVTMAKIAQAGATSGQALKWNGSAWAPADDADTGDDWGTQVVEINSTLTGDGTIGTPLGIATDGVGASHIVTDAVGSDEISAGAVGSSELASGAVTDVKVTDVSLSKITTSITGPLRGDGVGITTGNTNVSSEVTGRLAFSNFTQGSPLSVFGVPGSSSADMESIQAASDNQVLRRLGTAVGFGQVATAGLADAAVTMAKINQSSATSGQVLKWNGSAWAPADDATGGSGYLGWNNSVVSISSSTTETDILLDTIPSGTLSVDGQKLDLSILSVFKNNTGTNRNVRLRIYINGTSVYNDWSGNLPTSANDRTWSLTGKIFRNSSTTGQGLFLTTVNGTGAATVGQSDFATSSTRSTDIIPTDLFSATWGSDVIVRVTAELNIADANLTLNRKFWQIQN